MKNIDEPTEQGILEQLARYLSKPWVFLLTLLTITILLYSGTLSFDFVWDDGPQIANNPIIRTWHNLPRAFTSDLWYHVARHQVYYRPLFVAWSMLNYTLFALRPWGWHLGAIVAQLGAISAVFWLTLKLVREYWTAALASLIFALHPVHIETTAWISAASDAMVAMFVALAFVAFLNSRDNRERRIFWQVLSLLLLFCALLTKEMAVTFAVLIGVYVWMQPRAGEVKIWSRTRQAVMAIIPYSIITLAYVAIRSHALVQSTGQFDTTHGVADMLRTLPVVLTFYLEKLLVPVGLTGLYYTPYVTGNVLANVVLPALLLLSVAAALWYWTMKTGDVTIAFAGWWLILSLAPALYLRNFGNGDFVRDRYIYLPSIGFAILLAKAIRSLPFFLSWNSSVIQGAAAIVLCLAYGSASIVQQTYWANNFLLALRGEQLYPDNPYAKVLLSSEYSLRGGHERAIELAQAAVREHPEYVYGMLALAEANIRAKHFDEGRKWLDQFTAVSPEFTQSLTGMASLAGLYGRVGDFQRASAYCDQILAQEPNLYSAVYNCGNVQLMAGNYAVAEQLLQRASDLEPLQAAPKHFLGRALLNEGRNREAQPYLQTAVAMDPAVWDYHYWLAVSLEQAGDILRARAEYQQTLQLNQGSTEAKFRLAALEAK